MALDRETILQVLVSFGAVGLFIGVAVAVSNTYGSNGNITGEGGFALVGAMVMFILVMGVAGLWVERQDFGSDDS